MCDAQDDLPCLAARDDLHDALAGLYDVWRDPDGEVVQSYTVLTTEPNDLMASNHNWMPGILRRGDEDEWLDPENTAPEHLLPLLRPYLAGEMAAYPVSRLVNSPANDGPDILLWV